MSQTEKRNRKDTFAIQLAMHPARQPAWQGASRSAAESRETLELLAEPYRRVRRAASRCADEVGRQKRVFGPWIGCCGCSEKLSWHVCSDPGENQLPAGGPTVIKVAGDWDNSTEERVIERLVVHSGDPTGVGGAVDVGKAGADNIGSRSFSTAATAGRCF